MATDAHRLDLAPGVPPYAQLKNMLLRSILDGRFGADGRLPTEHEICETYGISRTPVHRALAELAEEGAVLRKRRAGTFVNPDWLRTQLGERVVRVVVPEGRWEELVRDAAPEDVRLDIRQVPLARLHDDLVLAVASGEAPDLALLDSVWVAEFSRRGFLHPLDPTDQDWIERQLEPEFAPSFVEAHRFGRETVAVQLEADLAGIWFDRGALSAAGIHEPATWSELRRAARRLQRDTKAGSITLPIGRTAGEASSYVLLALLASNGAGVLDVRGVTLHHDRAVEALEFLRAVASDKLIDLEQLNADRDYPVRALAAHRVSFAFGGSYELPALAEAAGLGFDQAEAWKRFGFLPVPAGPSGESRSLAGGMALGVFRQSARPELAVHVLHGLVSVAAQRRLAQETGQIPARVSVVPALAQRGSLLAVSAERLDGAVVRPVVDSYERVSQQLQALSAEIVAGVEPPRDAATRTAQMVSAITGLPLAEE